MQSFWDRWVLAFSSVGLGLMIGCTPAKVSAPQERPQGPAVAFLGDSISTGAVAHPAVHFDNAALTDIFAGKLPLEPSDEMRQGLKEGGFQDAADFKSPRRLPPSTREFAGGLSWLSKHAMLSFSHQFLDSEELSWSSFAGRSLGFSPDRVLIAAEDGARVEAAAAQLERVLENNHGVLPEQVYVLFTGNDLCGAQMDFVTSTDKFGAALERFAQVVKHKAQVNERGVDIWLVDPISILQLVQSEEIAAKKVRAHGQEMTCRELQRYPGPSPEELAKTSQKLPTTPEELYVSQFMPRSPAAYCPTIFLGKGEEGRNQQITLANRIHSFRREIAEFTKRHKDKAPNGVRYHHVTGTGRLLFAPEEIAEDCFHLSWRGQMRLARTILSDVRDENVTIGSKN